ncbi:P-loop containing nucleoside triphosphate hydrolase [Sesbania bispinosa]|nr:P-loop containing nucleoside triphosphate hydrolase [Sesbania bispinosa]
MKHFALPRNVILRDTPSPAAKPRPIRKLSSLPDNSLPATSSSDSAVKVIVRMRPPCYDKDEGDSIVQKISSDSLSINNQNFTFDSVTQAWFIELILCALTDDLMRIAWLGSIVLSLLMDWDGKTYTMWGPPNALSDDNATNDQQGLAPRVFERLFDRINEEQTKHSDKQLKYHCHCSFLEIYNEQITDLLDPNQRNLQVIVRMRPPCYDKDEGDSIVQKISSDSLSINNQNFTFDSLDIFNLVGVPLVENCLAGFNSSVFAYGQTGSGKTYTMWAPPNALFDDNATNDQQGLA